MKTNSDNENLSNTIKTSVEKQVEPQSNEENIVINSKGVKIIGYIASVLAVVMYVSYIPQIQNNLAGLPCSPIQPLAAMFNCIMWTLYALLPKKKDLPIAIANIPGILLSSIAFLTSLI